MSKAGRAEEGRGETARARGRALPASYRRNVVSDYRHYKLQRPGPGQRWVKVDNQYLLINSVSGMIAALVAAR